MLSNVDINFSFRRKQFGHVEKKCVVLIRQNAYTPIQSLLLVYLLSIIILYVYIKRILYIDMVIYLCIIRACRPGPEILLWAQHGTGIPDISCTLEAII